MKAALIVGHTGQDGHYLAEQLVAKGFTVLGVSRTAVLEGGESRSMAPGFDPMAQVSDFIRVKRPEQIYYLAACHGSSQDAIVEDGDLAALSWDTHVSRLERLMDLVRGTIPEARVFYASSSRVFGEGAQGPLDETSPLRPRCIYGLTKAAGMQVVRHFRDHYSIRACSGILFNHESPRRPRQYLSQRVVQGLFDVKQGRQDALVLGSLGALADWGYAPDYTLAMQQMLELEQPEDLVIATGRLHSVQQFVQAAARALGLDWRSAVFEQPDLLVRPSPGLCGDASRLSSLTGWTPSVDFDGMVTRLVQSASRCEA